MIDSKKFLILTDNKKSLWAQNAINSGYKIEEVFITQCRIKRIIRRVFSIHFNLINIFNYLEDWKYTISDYNTVLVFANILYLPVLRWIRRQNPNMRIILWYWDSAISCKLNIDKDLHIEQWSFDYEDCKKYNFTYHHTFAPFNMKDVHNKELSHPEQDIFFIGLDKGRYRQLIKIRTGLEAMHVRCKFIIVRERITDLTLVEYLTRLPHKYNKSISYQEVLGFIEKSNAILDIYQKGQSGLSQRPMEALYYKKKLITNSPSIQHSNFYHTNNVFILTETNIKDIPEFLKLPYHEIEPDILCEYQFSNWIDGFCGS